MTATETDLSPMPTFISAKKKYKPVVHKVKPVLEDLPATFHILRNIKGDPLADFPVLTPHLPHLLPLADTHKKEKNNLTKITHISSL